MDERRADCPNEINSFKLWGIRPRVEEERFFFFFSFVLLICIGLLLNTERQIREWRMRNVQKRV